MTENKWAVQVYIFRYREHMQRPHNLAVKMSDVRVNYPGDQGSDPGGVKILIFQISIPFRVWDALGYIDTHFD